jgi:hypothetical protein
MSDNFEAAKTNRLTRRALFEHDVQEAQRNGEPTEDMVPPTPSAMRSRDSKDSLHESEFEPEEVDSAILSRRQAQKAEDQAFWAKFLLELDAQSEERKEKMRAEANNTTGVVPSVYSARLYSHSLASARSQRSVDARKSTTLPDDVQSQASGTNSATSAKLEPYSKSIASLISNRTDDWDHEVEFQDLRDKTKQAARPGPDDKCSLQSHEIDIISLHGMEQDTAVPEIFSRHRMVHGLPEIGQYLGSSKYVISLGGPPLADLKYGIVIFPAGEEDLLFCNKEEDCFPTDFKDRILAKSKAMNLQEFEELNEILHDDDIFTPPPYELDDDDKEFYRQRWVERGKVNPWQYRHVLTKLEQKRMQKQKHSVSIAGSRIRRGISNDTSNGSRVRSRQDSPQDHRVVMSSALDQQQVNNVTETHPIAVIGSGFTVKEPSDHIDSIAQSSESRLEEANQDMELRSLNSSGVQSGKIQPAPHPLTMEARQAVESLLSQRKKPNLASQFLRVLSRRSRLYSRSSRLKSYWPDSINQAVLLEIANTIQSLADGKLEVNPGIDPKIWEMVRKDLALTGRPG